MSKNLSRITVSFLLALTVAVLVINARYLYVAPVPNTWTWWAGDETWLMAQYKNFIFSGHYINPLAPGSIYSVTSGIIFGSCYLTAAIYALPLLFIKGHTIDIGRTVTWFFSIVTLIALWQIAKRYRVGPVLRAFGVLLLSSTVCFFMTSHSARADMLVGLAVLVAAGYLPFLVEWKYPNRDLVLGLLLPAGLLINGHVLILTFLAFGYIAWRAGIFGNWRSFLRCGGAATAGFAILLILQWALLGSLSITGPFADNPGIMPYATLLHPRAQLANYEWRIFIARMWSPGILWFSALILASVIFAAIGKFLHPSTFHNSIRQLAGFVSLIVICSIYIEYHYPRSLIYVLPAIVLLFLVATDLLLRVLPSLAWRAFGVGTAACLAIGIWNYTASALSMGSVGEIITTANKHAVRDALAAVHAHSKGKPRVFSTTPAQDVAMDDSCQLLTQALFDWPVNKSATRHELWKRANVDFAIACYPGNSYAYSLTQPDSVIDIVASPAKLIFQRIGTFCDIDRPYDRSSLNLLDTLRVYEFR